MAITDLDEQTLVRAHQAGDEHAFGQIVRSQHRALYAHAFRRLGDHQSAEDAVQDTLLRAYRALPSFDGDLRLRAWLHRILTNVCHDEGNRRRRQSGLIDRLEAQPVELAPDPVEETVLHDTVRVMTEALADLPETYREALVLRYVDGLSFREVAEVAGVTEENARARVHRGRVALHKVLSRVTLVAAFLIPGMRRTQKALATGGDVASSTASEPTVSLTTQLATHVANAAPIINRVAAEGGNLIAAKTSMVATAAVAVAAVAAPVAAYKVYDTATKPEPRPAAVAAPLAEEPDRSPVGAGADPATGDDDGAASDAPGSTSTSIDTATVSTLPRSAVAPFEATEPEAAEERPTTTTSPPTTEAPPEETGTVVHGTVGGDAFTVEGSRPDFSISGPVVLQGTREPVSGTLEGRVYVADTPGGDASAELTMSRDDGTSFRVRFRGIVQAEEATEDGAVVWTLAGRYDVEAGESLGIAPTGTATIAFRFVDDAASSLRFDLEGRQQSD